VVPEIVGRRTQALHAGGETPEGGLSRGAVAPLVKLLAKPQIEGLVDFIQGVTLKAGQKAGSHTFEEPLDLPLPLIMWSATVH